MGGLIDETGNVYGLLEVVERAGTDKNGDAMWRSLCSCGKEVVLRGSVLRRGRTSCGCARKHGMAQRESEHPLYRVWKAMKWRCYGKSSKRYKDYGGRGIEVCDEWQEFKPFYEWAKDKWQQGLQIDRTNNDGSYCPGNCRFVTCKENNGNRRVRRTGGPSGRR